jgi:ribosomal protein S18 acetylase RimI-like enzyme
MISRDRRVEIGLGPIEDLDDFIEILEEVGSWLWRRGIHQWEPGSNRAQRALLERFIQSGFLVTARSDTGLVAGAIITRQPTAEWVRLPGPGAIYLHKLAVSRMASGRGLGRQLLSHCELLARQDGATQMRLDCWDGSSSLRSYYRSAGYRELEAVESHGYLVRLFEKSLSGPPAFA